MGVHDDLKKSAGGVKSATQNSPYHFAFIAKGADGALILGRSNPGATAIGAAKKEIGGSAVVSGKCFMEGGALVLETPGNPAATLAAGVKSCLTKHAGLTMQVNARAAGAAEEEESSEQEHQEQSAQSHGNRNAEEEQTEEESEEQPRGPVQGGSSKPNAPKPNAPTQSHGNDRKAEEEEQDEEESNEKAKISAKVKAIQPRLAAAMKGQGANTAKAHFDKAATFYRQNEFEQAEEELEELDKVLKQLGK